MEAILTEAKNCSTGPTKRERFEGLCPQTTWSVTSTTFRFKVPGPIKD
jgi:hypothetical protein